MENISSGLQFKIGCETNMIKSIFSTKVTQIFFKKEVQSLDILGVLEKANNSEWWAPSFSQPKYKTNWVIFIGYFRNLNKQLKRKTYQNPNINEMLFKLECFYYAK